MKGEGASAYVPSGVYHGDRKRSAGAELPRVTDTEDAMDGEQTMPGMPEPTDENAPIAVADGPVPDDAPADPAAPAASADERTGGPDSEGPEEAASEPSGTETERGGAEPDREDYGCDDGGREQDAPAPACGAAPGQPEPGAAPRDREAAEPDSADEPAQGIETPGADSPAAPRADGPEGSGAAADEAFGTMPRFLTREEYENFGDDPEPLPEGFAVIDGGPDASVPREIIEAARNYGAAQPAPARNLATAASEAASSMGSLIAHGVGAVREVSAAKRAHAEARGTLEELAARIDEQSRELAYRQDVTARFADIVSEQNDRKADALRRGAAARSAQSALDARLEEAKRSLDQMKESDSAAEKRLKAALESAEAHEDSVRESASRVKRRLTDAERALEKAREDQGTAVEAAERAVRAAEDRLSSLRAEYAELQRNPSANSAVYSVREGELAAEISDAVEELRRANGDLPRIREEVERTLAAAETVYAQAKEPIDEAKAEFRAAGDETASARDALEAARKDAAARQKELKDAIRDLEKERKAQQEAERAADEDAAGADASIEEAREIHAHPELTERIAAALAADRAELEETQTQVEELACEERSVRDRTRASRMKLGIAVGAGILLLVAIVLIWSALFN